MYSLSLSRRFPLLTALHKTASLSLNREAMEHNPVSGRRLGFEDK